MRTGVSLRVWVCGMCLMLLLGLVAIPQAPVFAAGTVNTCNEASFNAALAGGGTVTFNCSGTITLTTTKLISSNTIINGNGNTVILDGGGTVRLFNVAANQTLELHDLTLQNGYSDEGGAVFMTAGGTLVVETSVFSNNIATLDGGAIYADDDSGAISVNISISDSLFVGNRTVDTTGDDGGAIWIDGSGTVPALLEISGSTFQGNKTTFALSSGPVLNNPAGGAIYILSNTTANFEGNSFSGNQAGLDGGAIANTYNSSTLNFANNTFSGNSTGHANPSMARGGALHIEVANLVHNTFIGNSIVGGSSMYGSAIAWDWNTAAVVSRANIFSGNGGGDAECSYEGATGLYGSNNLTADGSCNTPTGGNAVTNLDTTLQDNGGTTGTHALLAGSNAVDAAGVCTYVSSSPNSLFANGATITRDQRGETRPIDGNGDSTAACDIGAFELEEDPAAVVLRGFKQSYGIGWLSVLAFGATLAGGAVVWKRTH